MSPDQKLVILYVPCGSEEEAARIATLLIQEHLSACANTYASRALYRWGGKVADRTEFVLWAKTKVARAGAAARRIEILHSYDFPCVLTLSPNQVNQAYAGWVRGEVSGLAVIEPVVSVEWN